MNPSHIYFKEIDIDVDQTFTVNFSKENEFENAVFDKDNEYAITGLKINAELPDKNILKIENVEEQNRVSSEIQEIIKNYKEPDLTLFMSHPETKTIEIPFVKKNESDLPKIKLTYFNSTTTKNEDFFIYDFIEHFKKFGFEWNKDGLGLNYQIKIDPTDAKKIQKKFTLNKLLRKKICTDESRAWNMKTKWRKNDSGKDSSRLSYLISYLYDEQKLKTLLKITGTKHDFTSMTPEEKNEFLNRLTKATHKQSDLYYGNSDTFYSGAINGSSVILSYILSYAVLRFTEKIQRLFVPKFYHNRRDKNFLKNLICIGEKKEIDKKYFYEDGTSLGRRLYYMNIKLIKTIKDH